MFAGARYHLTSAMELGKRCMAIAFVDSFEQLRKSKINPRHGG